MTSGLPCFREPEKEKNLQTSRATPTVLKFVHLTPPSRKRVFSDTKLVRPRTFHPVFYCGFPYVDYSLPCFQVFFTKVRVCLQNTHPHTYAAPTTIEIISWTPDSDRLFTTGFRGQHIFSTHKGVHRSRDLLSRPTGFFYSCPPGPMWTVMTSPYDLGAGNPYPVGFA